MIACIISSSWPRCSGDMLSMSWFMAAICCRMCSIRSSRFLTSGAEEVPPAVHELLEVRVLAAGPGLQHLVELLHHLPHLGDVLRRHLAQRLLHALERLLQHLLLQHRQQFLELLPRLRVHEVVVLEPLIAPAGSVGSSSS